MTSSSDRSPPVAWTAEERARTTIAIPARMTAGMTVQMISTRVLPWICGPSASGEVVPRRRKRITKRIRAVSTATNTTAQIAKTNQ